MKVPRYDEFDVEPIEQIMRPFFHGISSHQVIEEKGDVNNSISRVQWAQVQMIYLSCY